MSDTQVEDNEAAVAAAPVRKPNLGDFLKEGAPDVPLIREPDPGEVTLFYGLGGENEDRQKVAIVRELRGSDEEALSKLDVTRQDYMIRLNDMILKRCTVSIGDIDMQKSPALMGKLLLGDRDMLFKQIMLATYGTDKEYTNVVCPNCQEPNDFSVPIPEYLDIRQLPKENDPTVEVTITGDSIVKLRYPNGEDQAFIFQEKANGTEVERNTVMMQRCIIDVDGDPVRNTKKFVLDMRMPDRAKIVAALQSGPGVSFKEVEVPCASCNDVLPFIFGWADLLQV